MSISKVFGGLVCTLVLVAASATTANAQLCVRLEVPYQIDIGVALPITGTAADGQRYSRWSSTEVADRRLSDG